MKTRKRPSRIYGYILHQIMNEKRSNWALLAELLIVSCVVWYLVDCTYVMIVRAMEPTGFDTTNCYRVEISKLDEGSVGYDDSRPFSNETIIEDVTALLERLRREEDLEAAGFIPFTSEDITGGFTPPNISIRVKDERTQGFAERFREKIKNKGFRVGNHYISGISSYKDLIADDEREQNMQMRFYGVAIVFLLVNVFLGLLGTFWFRTQHRFPEIGLQKTFGATNTDITLRLLFEAVLLLTIAFVPSLLIDLNIAYAGLTEQYCGKTLAAGRFITCAAISYALMLLIIALGIWFPAMKAVKAEPVEVLKCPS